MRLAFDGVHACGDERIANNDLHIVLPVEKAQRRAKDAHAGGDAQNDVRGRVIVEARHQEAECGDQQPGRAHPNVDAAVPLLLSESVPIKGTRANRIDDVIVSP